MPEDQHQQPSSSTDGQGSARQAGDGLIRLGGLIAAIGVVASLVALLPLISDGAQPASWLWFVAIGGVGIGVAMALWGMVRAARERSKYLAPNE